MRCLGWLLITGLVCSRQSSSFVVRSPPHQNRCFVDPSTFTSRSRCAHHGPHTPLLLGKTLTGASRGTERQALNGGSRSWSSGSGPEVDSTGRAAAAAADNKADGATMGQRDTLSAGIGIGLDIVGSSTQWVVASAVGIALISRADVDTLVYVTGSLVNAVFSKILKKTINQVRPDGAELSDPGMPSSHAMSLFFLGTYLVIGLQEHGVVMVEPPLPQWPLGVMQTQALLGMYAFTASVWRVKAGLHTLEQVAVGAAVGSVDAVLWYHFCQVYFSSQAEALFGGPDIPVELAVGVCFATFFTFANVQRTISGFFARIKED